MAGAGLLVFFRPRSSEPPRREPITVTEKHPTLYCEFYNFMHNATVVAFDFAVGRGADANLTFSERFVVEHDAERTDFASDFPRWSYGVEEETPVITSPDTETRILLYGLRPKAPGIFRTEAGIRSNAYRNLEGKCRQAHLAEAAKGDPKMPR